MQTEPDINEMRRIEALRQAVQWGRDSTAAQLLATAEQMTQFLRGPEVGYDAGKVDSAGETEARMMGNVSNAAFD